MSGLERIVREVKSGIVYSLSSMILGGSLVGCVTGKMGPKDVQYNTADAMAEVQQVLDCPGGQKYYEDADGDGYGVNAGWWVCEALPGYVTNSSDCDDTRANVFPGGVEVCDGADNNCKDGVDENVTQSCSTKCGKGAQMCTQGLWGECSAGTYCPQGNDSCQEVIACEKGCTDTSCIEDCINKGTVMAGKVAKDFLSCMSKYECTDLYSSCVKKNCIDKYTSCFAGKMTCTEVLSCGSGYMTTPQVEIEDLKKMCNSILTDCVTSGTDIMGCFYDKKYVDCEKKSNELIAEKEKEKEIPGDLFGICAMNADANAIVLLYDVFVCLYTGCGAMPTPTCVKNKVFSCNLPVGVKGCL